MHLKPLFFFFLLPSSRWFSPSITLLHVSSSHDHSLLLSHYSSLSQLIHHHLCGFFPPFTVVFSFATHNSSQLYLARFPLCSTFSYYNSTPLCCGSAFLLATILLVFLCRGLPLSPPQFASLSATALPRWQLGLLIWLSKFTTFSKYIGISVFVSEFLTWMWVCMCFWLWLVLKRNFFFFWS